MVQSAYQTSMIKKLRVGHSTLAMSEHYMNVYADMAKDRFVEFNPLDNITRNAGTKRIVRHKSKANGGTA